jgi:RNA polymerase sigma factor (sigma-70 family)
MQSLSVPRPGPVVRPPAVAFRLASDTRLARLAATGSDGAMAAIFERHHQALHRYCHSIVGNSHDAADALQNTMIKALRALTGETRTIQLRPWLYRIAHNESISLLRARRADSDLDAAAHVSDAAAADVLESRERLRSLTEDLQELTERQRGALLMRELGGLEFTEVAAALGTSTSAVKQSVYEARRALESMQEGRTMDCETVQRTLSDGDRRMLRGLQMRGHLRACAPCRDFEVAMHHRPAQLTATIPPLPLAAAAAMLHGLAGGSSSAGGGGLAAGLAGSAKATTGISLATKAAAVIAISTTLGGGTAYTATQLAPARPQYPTTHTDTASATDMPHATPTTTNVALQPHRSRASAATASPRDDARPGDSARPDDGTRSRTGESTAPGRLTGIPRSGASDAGNPAGSTPRRQSRTGKPTAIASGRPASAGRPTGTASGRPAGAGRTAGTIARRPSTTPATAARTTTHPTGNAARQAATPSTPAHPTGALAPQARAPAAGTTAPQASTPAAGTSATNGLPDSAPHASTATTHGRP